MPGSSSEHVITLRDTDSIEVFKALCKEGGGRQQVIGITGGCITAAGQKLQTEVIGVLETRVSTPLEARRIVDARTPNLDPEPCTLTPGH